MRVIWRFWIDGVIGLRWGRIIAHRLRLISAVRQRNPLTLSIQRQASVRRCRIRAPEALVSSKHKPWQNTTQDTTKSQSKQNEKTKTQLCVSTQIARLTRSANPKPNKTQPNTSKTHQYTTKTHQNTLTHNRNTPKLKQNTARPKSAPRRSQQKKEE